MTSENYDTQIARLIYHKCLSTMKFTLDLEEQKYPDKGRHDDRYKFFKKQLMSETYNNIRSLLKELETLEMVCAIETDEDVKDGYKPTPSGGSGYINTSELDDWLASA